MKLVIYMWWCVWWCVLRCRRSSTDVVVVTDAVILGHSFWWRRGVAADCKCYVQAVWRCCLVHRLLPAANDSVIASFRITPFVKFNFSWSLVAFFASCLGHTGRGNWRTEVNTISEAPRHTSDSDSSSFSLPSLITTVLLCWGEQEMIRRRWILQLLFLDFLFQS